MHIHKLYLFALFFITILSTPVYSSTDCSTTYASKSLSADTLIKRGAGVGAAVLLHMLCEYPVVCMHEYGHLVGGYLHDSNGGIGTIHIYSNFKKSLLLSLLFPFHGLASSVGVNSFVGILGGPVGGMMACYSVIIIAHMLKQRSIKKGFLKGLSGPVTIYARLIKQIRSTFHTNNQKRKHKKSIFIETLFTTFLILRSGRMMGEFLNGFTPLNPAGQAQNDGSVLWSNIITGTSPIDITTSAFIGLTAFPTVGSIIYALASSYA